MAADNREGKDETGHARWRPCIGRGEMGKIPRYTGRKAIHLRRNTVKVFVLDKHKKSLMPCSPRRARKLMESGRARVHKRYPFTIRLVDRTLEESTVQKTELRIDSGSKHTGFAIVRKDEKDEDHVLHLSQLEHRGQQIHLNLAKRSSIRRGRRSRKTWYRPARFDNRTRPDGWIPPSLEHRVLTTKTWIRLYMSLMPLSSIAFEYASFDTQLMQNPEISGIEYQQGTLQGYETRQYLYVKYGRKCVYCDAEPKKIEIDHVIPRSKNGSDRVSNLVPSCHECNQRKGNRSIEDFLAGDRKRLHEIQKQLNAPLRDATAMNIVRPAILRFLNDTDIPVTCWSGARTKWNRDRLFIPKDHHLDAACVGDVKAIYDWKDQSVLMIQAAGHGSRKRRHVDRYGFPFGKPFMKEKLVHGFQTGDIVKAVVPDGKKTGTHIGKASVRTTGRFNIKTRAGTVEGIGWKNCTILQRKDGYTYNIAKQDRIHPADKSDGFPAEVL